MNGSNTHKDRRAQLKVGFVCANLAAISAACSTGCISVISSCEPNARYFSPSVTVNIFWALLAFSIALSFVVLFLFKREPVSFLGSHLKSAKVARISNILPALLSAFVTLYAISKDSLGQWGKAVIILGTISIAFFVLKLFVRPIAAKALTGMAVFALCAVIIASLYLDFSTELNSHFKLLTQFAAAGVICGVIADIRAALSSSFYNSSKKIQRNYVRVYMRGYVFLKLVSILAASACSAAVILYFAKGYSAFGAHHLVYSLFALSYALSSTCELIAAVIGVVKSHI